MDNSFPVWPNNIGKPGKYTMPDGTTAKFTIKDEIVRQSTQEPFGMLFYLQKLEYDSGETELRLAYYIIGKKPRMIGKWVFGQYAASMSKEDFKALVTEAMERNWI